MKATGQKLCPKCGQDMDIEMFTIRSDSGKRRTYCKPCISSDNLRRYHTKASTREAHFRAYTKHSLRTRYNLTPEEFDAMLEERGGLCDICKGNNRGRRLVVDHDHKTGKRRGLLCQGCNLSLGNFKDDPKILNRAIQYLAGEPVCA